MKIGDQPIERAWEHSMVVANFAKEIAKLGRLDKPAIDQTFLAGLLHDVGELILAVNNGERYSEVHQLAHSEKRPLTEV